jgi:hypothetical protein
MPMPLKCHVLPLTKQPKSCCHCHHPVGVAVGRKDGNFQKSNKQRVRGERMTNNQSNGRTAGDIAMAVQTAMRSAGYNPGTAALVTVLGQVDC